MDPRLEQISEKQRQVVNDLLFHVIDQCIEKSKSQGRDPERFRREEQARKLLEQLYGSGSAWPCTSIAQAAKVWSCQEAEWSSTNPDLGNAEALLYRLLVAVYRNHVSVPFTTAKRRMLIKNVTISDSDDFECFNAKLFGDLCGYLNEYWAVQQPKLPPELVLHLQSLENHNIDKAIFSARHKLMGKDLNIVRGVLVGGGAGVAASLILGPVIGTWIGNAAGYSGAAALSYGLASLGGGSLASGGFGMLGGKIVLGVAAGILKGSYDGKNAADTDLLTLNIACRNLPILLSAGRTLTELGYKAIPEDIGKLFFSRYQESERLLVGMSLGTSDYKTRRRRIELTTKLYKDAFELARTYEWTSGYDVYKKVF